MEGPLCDMLWADPLNEDDSHKLTDDEYQQFLDTDYVTNQVHVCVLSTLLFILFFFGFDG